MSRITKFSPSTNEVEPVPETKVTTPLIDGKVAGKKDLENESSLSKYMSFDVDELSALDMQIKAGNPGVDRSEKDFIAQALVYKKALAYEEQKEKELNLPNIPNDVLTKLDNTFSLGVAGMMPQEVQKYRQKIADIKNNSEKLQLEFDSSYVIPLLGLTKEERMSMLARDEMLPYLRPIQYRLEKISEIPRTIGLDQSNLDSEGLISGILRDVKRIRAGSQKRMDDIFISSFSENIPVIGDSLADMLVNDTVTEAKVGDLWDVLVADLGEVASSAVMYAATTYAFNLGIKGAGKLFNALKGKPTIRATSTVNPPSSPTGRPSVRGDNSIINGHREIIRNNLMEATGVAQNSTLQQTLSKGTTTPQSFREAVDINHVGRYTQQLKAINHIEATPSLRKEFLSAPTERARYQFIDRVANESRPNVSILPSKTTPTAVTPAPSTTPTVAVKPVTLPTGETLSNLSEARAYLTDFVLTGDKARKVAAKLSTEQLDTIATKLLNGEVPSGISELRNFILNKANKEALFGGATSNATKFMESYPGLNDSQYAFLADIESKLNSMAG